MSNKEVAKKEVSDLVIAEQDAFSAALSKDDYNVPFTRVLADLSAPVKDGQFAAGMIYNSGSGEAVANMRIVMVRPPEKTITVKTDDGEFVASFPFTEEKLSELTATQENRKRWDADGNSVFETLNYYILNVETAELSICPMLSSNYATAKAWNTRVRVKKHLSCSQMLWDLTTKEMPRGKGSYWKFDVPKFIGEVDEDIAELVADAKDMLQDATVDHSKGHEAAPVDESAY